MTGALAYPYVRMSSDEQVKGDSLRRQLAACRTYAEREKLTLDESLDLQDIGVSAYSGENALNGALGRFLHALNCGKVVAGSLLLVESLDRISRQTPLAAIAILLQIVQHGVRVVTVSDGHVFDSRMGGMDLIRSTLMLTRAHEESLIKSQRVGAAWENKRRNASTKKLTATCPAWLRLRPDRLTFDIIESAAEIVRYIFALHRDGLGIDSIERRLNREKVSTFTTSAHWHKSYVARLLNNRAVFGEFQPHSRVNGRRIAQGEPISGYYPSIVSEEIFTQCSQNRISRRSHKGGRRGSAVSNLFSHLVFCGYCEQSMRMINKGPPPKGGRYLICSTALRGLECVRHPWRYDSFEEIFLTYVKNANLQILLPENENKREKIDQLQSDATSEKDYISETEQKMKNVMMFTDSSDQISLEIAKNIIRDLRIELDNSRKKLYILESQAQEMESELGSFYDSRDNISAVLDLFSTATDVNVERVRSAAAQHLRSIIQRIELYTDGEQHALAAEIARYIEKGEVPNEDGLTASSVLTEISSFYESKMPMMIVQFKDGKRHIIHTTDRHVTGVFHSDVYEPVSQIGIDKSTD